MIKPILAAACLGLVASTSAPAQEEEFLFRARHAPATHRAARPDAAAPDAAAQPEPYVAKKGDTLWDVAGRFWNAPRSWPELWSLNPQIGNPHRIDPGEPIYLKRGGAGPEIHLPVETLAGEAAAAKAAEAAPLAQAPAKRPLLDVRAARAQAGHFVSSHRLPRLGTVEEQAILKELFATGDEIAVTLSGEEQLKAGDVVTIFDDSVSVAHPVTGAPQGYLVQVIGHLKIKNVGGRRATGEIVECYDPIEKGDGLTAYRKPVRYVTPASAKPGLEGVVLTGMPNQSLLGMEDVVFLDRGTLHGVSAGAVLAVPVPATHNYAGGLTDLSRPIAQIVVLTAEDKTSTGLILTNRFSVLPGLRFVAAQLSP